MIFHLDVRNDLIKLKYKFKILFFDICRYVHTYTYLRNEWTAYVLDRAYTKVNIWRFATISLFHIKENFTSAKFCFIRKHRKHPISKTKGPIKKIFNEKVIV